MQLPATARRVENSTDQRLNERIRARADAEVIRLEAAGDADIAQRLRELDDEWDVERLLQVNASVLVMLGVVLGARVDRRFLALPAAVFAFFGQHALQGWCPPIPVIPPAGRAHPSGNRKGTVRAEGPARRLRRAAREGRRGRAPRSCRPGSGRQVGPPDE